MCLHLLTHLSPVNLQTCQTKLFPVAALGQRVRGGNQLFEGASSDVSQKAGGVREEAPSAGAADQ